MNDARVILWGRDIGAVSWLPDREIGVFQYRPEFVPSGIEIAPLMMPLREAPYSFPELARETFHGLPGLLSDSLPDKYGNRMINTWLAAQGRTPESFNPVERLCYVGKRGMGALEFEPREGATDRTSLKIEIEELVLLANRVLDERARLGGLLNGDGHGADSLAFNEILRVGTSAGGARAKAVLAWNPKTDEFRSGQVDLAEGFEHWLVKFDGVSGNRDKELADPQGYGLIEYAYHLMAVDAGIEMTDCRLHKEGGRSHFMTRRFDRTPEGKKLHMQSLGAMAHFDYNQAGAYSYEQAIKVMRKLDLTLPQIEQQYLRTVFNLVARNQDDHVKNIAFLMDKAGRWSLAPAFDVIYAWQPDGAWTGQHQMSVNGKRDRFTLEDLLQL
ncbi:MAG: type II toxin-antitoxin system HipA family toxin, partial [Gammaproteobacteria bacterium]